MSERRIVCVANRSADGVVVLGVRHHDTFMHDQAEAFHPEPTCWEQGFIDQRGNFLGRQEAWQVAQAAGQIIRRVGGDMANGGTLFSENLY